MMSGRKDAAVALYALANAINEEFPKTAGDRSVWTMGRAVIHPGSRAWIPNSPNVISVWPLELPLSRPRCCLR